MKVLEKSYDSINEEYQFDIKIEEQDNLLNCYDKDYIIVLFNIKTKYTTKIVSKFDPKTNKEINSTEKLEVYESVDTKSLSIYDNLDYEVTLNSEQIEQIVSIIETEKDYINYKIHE